MPTSRKNIIYTKDTWDTINEVSYSFSAQSKEFDREPSYPTLFSNGAERYFVNNIVQPGPKKFTAQISRRIYNTSLSQPYWGCYTNVGSSWASVLAGSGTSWLFSENQGLYKYSGAWVLTQYNRARMFLNFYHTPQEGYTITRERIWLPMYGPSGNNYTFCSSEPLYVFKQESGSYPLTAADAKAAVPGTPIATIDSFTVTGVGSSNSSGQKLAIDIPIGSHEDYPLTLMIDRADWDVAPIGGDAETNRKSSIRCCEQYNPTGVSYHPYHTLEYDIDSWISGE